MEDFLKIVCPHCQTTLQIPNEDGVGLKNTRCPKCKQTFPIAEGIKSSASEDTNTNLVNTWHETTKTLGVLETRYEDGSSKQYMLKVGRNLIGRSTLSDKKAEIQIEDPTKTLSRHHLIIEVVKYDTYFEHRLSLADSVKNKTYLDGHLLEKEDVIVLNFNDKILCGKCEISFRCSNSK